MDKNTPIVKRFSSDGKEKEIYELSRGLTTIGSDPYSHILLKESLVAEHHACIMFKMGEYYLKNLYKADTVKVNNGVITDMVKLNLGDKIDIGSVSMSFVYPLTESDDVASGHTLQKVLQETKHSEVLRLFSDIVRTITTLISENNPESTSKKLVEIVAHMMHCDGVRLLMKNENDETETFAVYPPHVSNQRFSKTAIKWADERKETVLVSDVEDDMNSSPESSMIIKNIRSVLCAPLFVESNEIIGYLYLDRLKGHTPFSQQDRELFEELRSLFSKLLGNTIQKQKQAETINELQEKTNEKHGLIFESECMQDVVKNAISSAKIDVPVLIQGETGTGKELLARLIHNNSNRSDGPFIAVNCGAIPEQLMESEFFGHEKGAFTGAVSKKKGHMEEACGGTLLLDEVGELPIELQVKLLRALQENEITPVGSSRTVPLDIRIISATNADLEKGMIDGTFRQDLFFRLNVINLKIPPLRSREQDIILLANYFIKKLCAQYGMQNKTLSKSAEKHLLSYSWSGNVRELENKIQKALILSKSSVINPQELDIKSNFVGSVDIETLETARSKAEKETIINALTKSRGNISLAGKILEVNRVVLGRLIKKLEINPSEYKDN